MIKCVIWDIDNTLLDGVYLESVPPPAVDPVLLGVLRELAGRGIVHALASRNPPEAAEYVGRVTGEVFAAAECGWGPKSDAVARIIGELDMSADAVAFVDDELLERAEVSSVLPEVLVLAAEDMPDAVGWPQFSPPVVTAEARRRGEMYAQRRHRQEMARAFGGSRDAFLRYCETRVVIGRAGYDDVPRLHELSERTHQLNSAGSGIGQAALADLIGMAAREVLTVRLSDRFGDDGIVGGCVVDTGSWPAWRVQLLMMSCRAMGRGVIDALLAWLCQAGARAGAQAVTVPCLVTARNVPLRIALTGAGFRADAPADAPADAAGEAGSREAAPGQDGTAVFGRRLDGPLPELPGWASAPEQP
jgi:methoxymalonate biosynthesis protein